MVFENDDIGLNAKTDFDLDWLMCATLEDVTPDYTEKHFEYRELLEQKYFVDLDEIRDYGSLNSKREIVVGAWSDKMPDTGEILTEFIGIDDWCR